MNKHDDGVPAFPKTMERFNDEFVPGNPGMSLRDYFAAAALAGYLAIPGSIDLAVAPEFIYKIADAMIEERSRNGRT